MRGCFRILAAMAGLLAGAAQAQPGDGAVELRRSAALTPLQRGQTKADDHFHHLVVAPVEAT